MARRGEQLRDHILWSAKDVFLDTGFERASMDQIAARAETSKRTLYAHFENKEKLYLAVIDLVRGLSLNRLKTPGDYPGNTAEALEIFCARYLETLLYAKSVQMCRLSIAEASRFSEGSAQYFDVIYLEVHKRLSEHLAKVFTLSPQTSAGAAQTLLGRVIHPRFLRALFGIDALVEDFDDGFIAEEHNLQPIRKAVAEMIDSLARR